MVGVCPVDLGAIGVGIHAEPVVDVDALDHEHAVFDLDLAGCFGG